MVTMRTVDVIDPLVKAIALDPVVYALCESEEHTYGGELPKSENDRMTERQPAGAPAVVLQLAGGPGDRRYARWTQQRVDVRCYGQTPKLAAQLGLAVHDVLKRMHGVRMDGMLIHHAVAEAGLMALREPKPMDWPFVLQPWIVTYNEVSGEIPPAGG